MNEEIKDVVKWIYYTGMFLSDFDKNINLNNESSVTVLKKYLEDHRFETNTNMKLWNQGTMLMLLYGLLVLPQEFWRRFLTENDKSKNRNQIADDLIFEKFNFTSLVHFKDENCIKKTELNNFELLRLLRNAVAHNRIEIIKSEEGFIKFSNIDSKHNEKCTCIQPIHLTKFLSEIGQFFINNTN